jgi:hypothetical protein
VSSTVNYHFMSSLSIRCMVQSALTLQNLFIWSGSMTVNVSFYSWEVALAGYESLATTPLSLMHGNSVTLYTQNGHC